MTPAGHFRYRIDDALERSAAYAAAGADSLFVPGLVDSAAIAELANGPLPVAVMVWPGAPSVAELALTPSRTGREARILLPAELADRWSARHRAP